MIPRRLLIVFLAVAASCTVTLAAHADPGFPDGAVAVVAAPATGGEPTAASSDSDGMITVFLEEPSEGFSDGGDVPEGMVVGLAERVGDTSGFSDGGDVLPDGFIIVLAQPAPAGFSDGGAVPEGMIAVRARPAGFSDGGDTFADLVAVMLEPVSSESSSPPGG